MVKFLKSSAGFTLQEVLIVLTVMVLLAVFLGFYLYQVGKGRDSKRKSDIQMIKIALEDYFNDNGCYPNNLTAFDRCGSNDAYPVGFSPYLKSIPCDSLGNPYKIVVETSSCPSWFMIYTNMENPKDPQVKANQCSSGCTIEDITYNYLITSDNLTTGPLMQCGESLCFIRRAGTGPCNGPLYTDNCPQEPGDRCFVSRLPSGECDVSCEVKSCTCVGGCVYEPL